MLTCLCLGTTPRPLAAADLQGIEAVFRGGEMRVSAVLEDAFPEDLESQLERGLELSFEHTVRLRRRRRGFFDRTVSERYVVVTAQYSKLTKMFKLTRRVDGTVTESELTAHEDLMRRWMTRLDALPLFDRRDLDGAGSYYVELRTKLQRRFRLLFVPADLQTHWARSPGLEIDPEGERP